MKWLTPHFIFSGEVLQFYAVIPKETVKEYPWLSCKQTSELGGDGGVRKNRDVAVDIRVR